MNPKKIARKLFPARMIVWLEESYRTSRIYLMHLRYGFPAKHLRVVGVTGTNGKTTTANVLNDILKASGQTTALFSTAVIEMAGERRLNDDHRTVPLSKDLLKFFKAAKQKKVDTVVAEVTSHALDQHKFALVPFKVAVMTNLTQDHLDYHKSMDNYAAAKALLFNTASNPRYCILNADDEWFQYFAKQSVGKVQTYGKDEKNDLSFSKIRTSSKGTTFTIASGKQHFIAHIPLVGDFNVYNTAAALLAAEHVGVGLERAVASLRSINLVPGRLELVPSKKQFAAYVDYAHTPDALTNVLKTVKASTKGRLILVFGATGDRDKTKRPIMGEIANQEADLIFLTDEETYSEDGAQIRKQIFDGIVKAGGKGKTTEIADRGEAIKQAALAAKPGDAILVTGLGHQSSRVMAGQTVPWVETEVVRNILSEI